MYSFVWVIQVIMDVRDEESSPQTVVRVLIAEDHDLVREALRYLIDSYTDLRVIGEAKNGADAVRLAGTLRPDIILLDFHMPVMDGSEAARTIRRHCPDAKIIGMSVHPSAEMLMRQARASAHVEKAEVMTKLYPLVRMVMGSNDS